MKLSPYFSFRHLFKNVVLAFFYSVIFVLCYLLYLNHYFDYAGFELHPKSIFFYMISFFISLLPIAFYRGLIAISSFISLFTYIVLYIPIILTFSLGSALPLTQILIIQLSFMVCMCLFFVADRINIPFGLIFKVNFNVYNLILALTVISCIYMLFIYRSNLTFVMTFGNEIYELRSANDELGNNIITRYLSSWLSSFMIPLCLAYGIISKKWVYFIVGSAACVIIYMATASKGIILFPLTYLIFYYFFKNDRINNIYSIFIFSLSLLLGFLLLVTTDNNIAFIISSLFMSRVVGNGGLLTMWYYDFFETHPYTYYSHINLVEMVTNIYPYGETGLGFVVGRHYWSNEMNANANFWATDGIAAFGIFGVFLSSIFCFFIFIILNSITRSYNKLFLILVFIPFIYSFLNTSLFSTMWSGGGFLLSIFFCFLNSKSQKLVSN